MNSALKIRHEEISAHEKAVDSNAVSITGHPDCLEMNAGGGAGGWGMGGC